MTRYLLIVSAALTLSFALTPVVRSFAKKIGSLDNPGSQKIHVDPVPLLGGVVIYLAVISAVFVFGEAFYVRQAAGILIGASMISFTGLLDDHRSLRPETKILIQICAASIVVATGIQIQLFGYPFINISLTLLWIIVVSNAFNLIDNMDGLSAGLSAIAAFFFLILSALNGQYLVGMLSAATLGACLGFLYYNRSPATIFMGDAGSLFLGFLLAAIGVKLRFVSNSPVVTWMVPIIVLAVPLFDTLYVSISRTRRGQSIVIGGKDHTSHVLLGQLVSHRRVVARLYQVAGIAGILAVIVSYLPVVPAYLLALILLSMALWAFVYLSRSV